MRSIMATAGAHLSGRRRQRKTPCAQHRAFSKYSLFLTSVLAAAFCPITDHMAAEKWRRCRACGENHPRPRRGPAARRPGHPGRSGKSPAYRRSAGRLTSIRMRSQGGASAGRQPLARSNVIRSVRMASSSSTIKILFIFHLSPGNPAGTEMG